MSNNPVLCAIENRNNFPAVELAKYENQWVAWTRDRKRIVAGADDLDQLEVAVKAAGMDLGDTVLELILPFDMAFLGGAG